VADSVRASLEPLCDQLSAPATPRLVATATMWHLQTEIVGELTDPRTSSLQLALALHPTPAVCGVPTAQARATIGELEGFDRDFYAGVVGWCDRSGDGEWVVAIRCAEVRPESLRLYSGAGIVAGSVPSAEVAETSAKFRTMLEAIGLDDVA
jgi:isochorismate synthase